MLKVYIGWDAAEEDAFHVAKASLLRRSTIPVDVIALDAARLSASGLLRRPVDARGGQLYDIRSNAPQATEFAISRFLTPILAQSGLALFMDCDMVVLGDVAELVALADPTKAVQVVKHQHAPMKQDKMCGKTQTQYLRKNWSSVVLWNCDHPANRRLTLDAVNHWPGRELHAFAWLNDCEIGELPLGWNWLVNEQPEPQDLRIAHFTNGGPWFENWTQSPHDEVWLMEASRGFDLRAV